MNLNKYQEEAVKTAIYSHIIIYPALGLAGEAGECCEHVKKVLRDNDGIFDDERREELKKEVGDTLWYIANLANDLGYTLEEIAQTNLEKLKSRQERGVLKGSGDNR